jgi:phosphate-selective porin OprO and OprP
MERANTYMLSPDRHIGAMIYDHFFDNENTTWAIGAFCSGGGDGGTIYQDTKGHTATALTSRMTWLPWYDEATNGRGLLHLGLAGSYRDAWNNNFPLTSAADTRPEEAHLAQSYNAVLNNIDYVEEVGAEMAYVYGPFSVQSEYVGAFAHPIASDTTDCINSCYVFFSYFLTGENRVYDRNSASFTRVKPYENFFRVRGDDGNVATGKGAWELGYRWSYIDFSDAVTSSGNGSQFSNQTVGLNWYLNPYTRLMLNDVYSTELTYTKKQAFLNTIELRAQIDF